MADVGEVLTLRVSVELKLKRKRCTFLAENMDNLGHVIRPKRLEISDATTKAIQELQDPTMQTEMWSSLVFAMYAADP